ncbi:hypothetical protein NITLEN_90111 [Nitrospira lenta]|uniref:Uncharacterized protein n=1 Tax=Nitrospira lenta TaxID=1436998 RepID=A0A330LCY4_9BACT|nr:hypothetical protein NITLEN_90111 [Nitrospira lenta]
MSNQLEAQHHELLIENVAGLGAVADFLRQGFLVSQQRLRLVVFSGGLSELEITHGRPHVARVEACWSWTASAVV